MSKNAKVVKQDEDKPKGASKKLIARVGNMSDEEKNALAAQLGFNVKKVRTPAPKEPTKTDKFNEANGRLDDQIDSIHTILEGCEFPNGFALTIGRDASGDKTHNCKQVRAQYAARKGADASA
jgi:hypothetical protein